MVPPRTPGTAAITVQGIGIEKGNTATTEIVPDEIDSLSHLAAAVNRTEIETVKITALQAMIVGAEAGVGAKALEMTDLRIWEGRQARRLLWKGFLPI